MRRLAAAAIIVLLSACSDPNAEANKRVVQARSIYD